MNLAKKPLSELEELQEENARLRKINDVLIKRVEASTEMQGSAYSIFQNNITLEKKVKERTAHLKKIEAQLRIEKEAAISAFKAKSSFLANISHELRTPLHGIISFAEIGLEEVETNDPKDIKDSFQEILTCSKNLLNLLNNLLDLAKLEQGKMTYKKKQHSVEEVIKEIAKEQRNHAAKKNIPIQLHVDPCVKPLCFDRMRIAQVLRNLLSNAIRYSYAKEPIDIKATCFSEEDHYFCLIKVINRGEGIPKDELELIFDNFQQSSRTDQGAGGTGLGLPICRQIVNDHHGRIWAESEDQGETTFSFFLRSS